MPAYFGHEMSRQELSLQVLADDLALVYVRSTNEQEKADVLERIEASGMQREMWEDTLARARRYVDG